MAFLPAFLGNVKAEDLTIPKATRETTWLRMWERTLDGWQPVESPGFYKQNEDDSCIIAQALAPPERLLFLQIGGDHVPSRLVGYPPAPGPVQILIGATDQNTTLNGGSPCALPVLMQKLSLCSAT